MSTSNLSETLSRLRQHPQDHGWRAFFDAIDLLLQQRSAPLQRLLEACVEARPRVSPTHLMTLLGMTVKMVIDEQPAARELFAEVRPVQHQARALERLLSEHEATITETLLTRQNSFTGVRRFLVPQTLFARYFARQEVGRVNFLDVGTGLGLLPRQLNNRRLFERFAPDLAWPFGIPSYQSIPLGRRYGLDRFPLPDLAWVRHCYGPSYYYDRLFDELLWVLREPVAMSQPVGMTELDILDEELLRAFVREHRIQAVNCSFVLYQYDQAVRSRVIAGIVDELVRPGLLISMEPKGDLTLQGCHVSLFAAGSRTPVAFATVTDSHFVGAVLPGDDYRAFTVNHL